jgi:hypothetical protein
MRPFAVFFLTAAIAAAADSPFVFWPDVRYELNVPSLKQVLGYEVGERITTPADIIRYFERLSAAAPTRIKVVEYGRSWEGQPLIYAAIGSETNMRRLNEIRAGINRLADPRRTTEAEAKKLTQELPAVVWLGYGVHGNEISSSDAAMLLAYHLLAVRGHKMTEEVLANTIVLIDPMQNPDGRQRFIQNFIQNAGLVPDAEPTAAEHVEPWPSGRFNHYNFDMNRDWFALTQPETRGRIKALLEWYPLVFVDLHEMGSNSTYYFAPEAVPYNPHLTADQTGALEWFGRNNAKWFDKFGFRYFTREVYDAFYPGYGASWPAYYGAVAMTYEQASARGLVMRRNDEQILTFRDTVRQHFVASLSTCEAAAANRAKLLEAFRKYRETAVQEGQTGPIREYVLLRKGDTSAVDKLANLLVEQGVEVRRATAPFQASSREAPAGSYLISLNQPAKRLIRNLLDRDVPMSEPFVKEEERRRSRKLPSEIYDVTAWSLPLLFNVETVPSAEAIPVASEPVNAGTTRAGSVMGDTADVGYLVPWGTAAAGRFLAAALRSGLKLYSVEKPFTQNGRSFPAGTLVLPASPELRTRVKELAASSGAEVVATSSGWVEDGVNFGSRYAVTMRPPRIALAWDAPTSPSSAGNARFVLERQFGYPVSVIRTAVLAATDLSRYDVLILPAAGNYDLFLTPPTVARLKAWVSQGGTIIAYQTAVEWLSGPKVGLLDVKVEKLALSAAPSKDVKPPAPPGGTPPGAGAPLREGEDGRVEGRILVKLEDYQEAIRPRDTLPDNAPGAILKAKVDPDHWLGAAVSPEIYALVTGSRIFTPIRLDKGVNVAYFAEEKELLASGYLWEENRKQLAFKPLVVAQRQGRGYVIGFTADPTFRAFQDGLNILLLNAVFRGPAHAQSAAPSSAEE